MKNKADDDLFTWVDIGVSCKHFQVFPRVPPTLILSFLSSRKKDICIVFGILNLSAYGNRRFFVLNESLYPFMGDDLTLAILAAGEKLWEAPWVWNWFGPGFFVSMLLSTHTRLYD